MSASGERGVCANNGTEGTRGSSPEERNQVLVRHWCKSWELAGPWDAGRQRQLWRLHCTFRLPIIHFKITYNTQKTGAPQRTKPQEHKAARIPQNELLDLIYDCFKRYNYWSLKALKAELNQPEAYLRSTLEMVAELVKSGRFAMTWTLKPENKIDQYAGGQAMEEQAPDAGYGMEGVSEAGEGIDDGGGLITGDDDDDDSVKMEDVMLL